MQSESNWQSFFILNGPDKTVDCSIHFHLQDGVAKSPFKATYGGFDFNDGIERQLLLAFVNFVEQQLHQARATQILIKLPLRLMYQQEFNWVEDVLLKSDFKILNKEEGCILRVSDSFDERIHSLKRKRLNRTIQNRFKFDRISDIGELENVYSFLLQCRTRKNYNLSMSLQEVSNLASLFPDKVLLFGVRDDNKLVAASICIRVRNEVLYDFYHDHHASYDDFSPIVFLIKGINEYSYANGIPLLDLGTAMIGDQVNAGLLQFKLELGADHAVKYSFEKKI